MCYTNMQQMDPEPDAVLEIKRQRNPAQCSLLLAVTKKMPVYQQPGVSASDAIKSALHTFPESQVLKPAPSYECYDQLPAPKIIKDGKRIKKVARVLRPAPPYADYEDVPKAAGRACSAKRTRSPVVSPPGSTGDHFGKVCIYFTETLAYLSGLYSFWSVRLTLLPALCVRLLLTRPVTLTAVNGVSLLFLPSCLATQQ